MGHDMQNKLWILVFVGFLSACTGNQTKQPTNGESTTPALSAHASDEDRLSAAENLYNNFEFEKAALILKETDFSALNITNQTRYALLAGKVFVASSDPQQALVWLAGEYTYLFDSLPQEQLAQISLLRASAWELSGQYLAGARERIYLAPVLSEPEYSQNHEMIWADLQLVPEQDIQALAGRETSPDLQGWMELALVNNNTEADIDSQVTSINTWITSHPRHPAAQKLPDSLALLTQIAQEKPRKVALLLPLSGPLSKTGDSIRDGFMASYYQSAENGREVPEITFVDTANLDNVIGTYTTLVSQGTQLFIGPLEKKLVSELLDQPALPIPVLALNNVADNSETNHNVYQFGLAPEDEAVQVARKAFLDGHRSAVILVPNGNWGDRISSTFTNTWRQLGGSVASQAHFDAQNKTDYLRVVRHLFNIDASVNRTAALERTIGESVEYEPRRRQDFDLIFLAALPAEARQLKPLFDFQYAANVPVYGISTLYGGTDDPVKNKDIETIRFVDMPWQLSQPELKQQIHDIFGEKEVSGYDRLYALGVDAYALYPRLRQLVEVPGARLHGMTGILSIDSDSKVKRELEWAQIKDGLAQPILSTLEER
ncbi:putative lipoprotein [Gynuella sunshinyii YC6258]|uniref:Putative lipoprotein n=2 Tax=Gynuella sunshinyii TaxID=1445505 RepID=A0A0C5V4K7_9GAMM|nr:putative lipoprotein [Gynuella sunshinyii YC6258]